MARPVVRSGRAGRTSWPRWRRPVAMLATVALLGVLGPALSPWAAPAAGQSTAEPTAPHRPPGVPPPANLDFLPAANKIAPRAFDGGEGRPELTQITGPVLPSERTCVTREDAGNPTVVDIPTAQRRMRVGELRQFATGAGQKIAVIDTGIRPHKRLAGRLTDGGDYILDKTALEDCDGHGTIVAGIIAAADDPETGFTGVAPDAEIISIRQTSSFYVVQLQHKDDEDDKRTEESGNTTTMARAVVRAVQLGATVINISAAACVPVGTTTDGHAQDLQAAVKYAVDNDVVVVVAAGNTNEARCAQNVGGVSVVTSPAWFDEVLTVAAIDSNNGAVAEFSVHGPWVDVAAPGTEITSLDPASDELANQLALADGQIESIQGTSFATPYVAGVAALVRERFPELTARQVMDRIRQTAQRAPGQPVNPQTGYGVVDAVAALTAMIPEENGVTPTVPSAAALDGLRAPPVKDPFPTKVAIVGASAGLGLLGLTMFIVFAVHRYRRRVGLAGG